MRTARLTINRSGNTDLSKVKLTVSGAAKKIKFSCSIGLTSFSILKSLSKEKERKKTESSHEYLGSLRLANEPYDLQ